MHFESDSLDELIGRRVSGLPWSDHVDDAKGVFRFLEQWVIAKPRKEGRLTLVQSA